MNYEPTVDDKAATSSNRTIFSLLHAAHALEDRVEETLGQVGLSMPKYSVITELVSADKALSLSDLASRLSCVKSNMTQLVDRLEADGLVRRVDDPNDRRSVKAAITDDGREKQAAGADLIDRLNREFAESVGDEDRAAVERLLAAFK